MRQKGIKYLFPVIIISLLVILSCKNNVSKKADKPTAKDTISFLDENNFEEMEVYLKNSAADPDTVWFMENGILKTTGKPFGYIQTGASYKNYTLTVEWRWPGEAGNSGVFIHKQEKDKIWPACFEAQLWHQHAGDLITMGGTSFKEKTDTSTVVYDKQNPSSEKEPGEWNKYVITCIEDSVHITVNGTYQNKATQTSVQSGKICLQSEGTPIEFRSFYLVKE
jgi:hypothetical protein